MTTFFQANGGFNPRRKAAVDACIVDRWSASLSRPCNEDVLREKSYVFSVWSNGQENVWSRRKRGGQSAVDDRELRRLTRRDQSNTGKATAFGPPLVDVVDAIDVVHRQSFRGFNEDPAAVVAEVVDNGRNGGQDQLL